MNFASLLAAAGVGYLGWKVYQRMQADGSLPKALMPTDPSLPPGSYYQGADYVPPGNLLPPVYGPYAPTYQAGGSNNAALNPNPQPVAVFNPPNPPAAIVATNPAAANPPTPVATTPAPSMTPPPVSAPGFVIAPGPTGSDIWSSGRALAAGSAVRSLDNKWLLAFTHAGSLQLFDPLARVAWTSGTDGRDAVQAILGRDGDISIRKADGTIVWRSGTAGNDNAYVKVQNDGNMAMYTPDGRVVWVRNSTTR